MGDCAQSVEEEGSRYSSRSSPCCTAPTQVPTLGFATTEAETMAGVFVATTNVKSLEGSSMRRVSSGISLDVSPQNSMETTNTRQNRWRVWQAQFISIRLYIERSANSTREN